MATLALPALLLTAPAEGAASAAVSTYLTQRMFLTAIGSIIDNAFIFPALFPPDPTVGARIDDQSLTSAKEGEAMNYCIGPSCRCDGELIWKSRLIEIKDTSSGGGKGGQSGNFVIYKYYVHAAIAICNNETEEITKIWADGKVLFNIEPDINITAGQLTNATGTIYQVLFDLGGLAVTSYFLTVTSPLGSVDLSHFVSGKQVTFAGFTAGANNGVLECVASGTNTDGSTYVKVRRYTSTFTAFAATTQTAATLFQDAPSFSAKQVQDIIFYHGTDTQTADPLIEGIEGSGNVPGYRGMTYVVFQNLALQDFGNRLPNFTFLVKTTAQITIGDAISKILTRAGIDPSTFDVSAIQDQYLEGYTISGPQSPISSLQPILIAYNIAAQLRDGVLTFVYRPDLPVVSVDASDLGAQLAGASEDKGNPFTIDDVIDYQLNSSMSVEYMDPDKDYQTGTQNYTPANPQKDSPGSITLPLVLTSDKARQIAENLYWLQWVSRQKISLTLPPSYISLREGDILQFTWSGTEYNVLVQRIDRGQESQFLSIEGTIEDTSLYDRTVTTEIINNLSVTGYDEGPNYGYPASLYWRPLDIPALREEHLNVCGFYLAASNCNQNNTFSGAVLYESTDEGSTYNPIKSIAFAATMGYSTTYPSASASSIYWDDDSVITVVITNGSLSSVTDRQCLNGQNRAVLGNEVIGFVNAVLVSENTYELSRLLRGLRGTENEMTHSSNECFVLLNAPGVEWVDLNSSAIGTTRYYKLVPAGGFLELCDALSIKIQGMTMQPFAPTDIVVSEDASHNYTISFTPRSRALSVGLMPQGMPVLDEVDQHHVDVYHLSNFKRRITSAEGVYSVSYSAAEQTADGLTPGAAQTYKVYRKSSRVYSVRIAQKLATPVPL